MHNSYREGLLLVTGSSWHIRRHSVNVGSFVIASEPIKDDTTRLITVWTIYRPKDRRII